MSGGGARGQNLEHLENVVVQPQKMVRGLKMLDLGSRGIVLFSDNKGADQLMIINRQFCILLT